MPDARYWETKILNYLHDPPFKALGLREHEELAQPLIEAFALSHRASEIEGADPLAASADRAVLPNYKQGGLVRVEEGGITHPLGGGWLEMRHLAGVDLDQVAERVRLQIRHDLATLQLGRCAPDEVARRKFLYLHLVLRQRLAVQEPSLGGLWYRLPADTRMPDHSIWQHCALTSALASCKEPKGGIEGSLLVWGIGPVQDYIEKSRKARDLWTGSVILSYLAFAGLRCVMDELGPDHVLYPSLVDQPLVAQHLKVAQGFPEDWLETGSLQCPSFPNKAVVLVPSGKEPGIAKQIEEAIGAVWNEIWQAVHETVIKVGVQDEQGFWDLWKRQCESFWSVTWAAFPLIDGEHADREALRDWFAEPDIGRYHDIMERFRRINPQHVHAPGVLYGLAHQGAQGVYGAAKLVRKPDGRQEPGEKCVQCAEFQQLHDPGAGDGREAVREFWRKIAAAWQDDKSLFKRAEKERLCALCLTKRLASLVFEEKREHLLSAVFHRAASFKSTTELAGGRREEEDRDGSPDEPEGRYYAILLMDGDEMGKIVAGAPRGFFTWKDVLAPPLVKRITGMDGEALRDQTVAEVWRQLLPGKRLLTPARHAAISEALGYFSTVTVPQVIEQHGGELIYAGGDDVLALMPVRTVLKAAQELAQAYQWSFLSLVPDSEHRGRLKAESLAYVSDKPGRLVVHMGPKATISAGIAIVHHKAPFKWALRETHRFLLDDMAKKRCGRGAFAIGLYKRSGGPAMFGAKWETGLLDKLQEVAEFFQKGGQELSRSLAYHVEALQVGLEPLAKQQDDTLERMLEKLLDKSVLSGEKSKQERERLAVNVAQLLRPEKDSHRGDRWADPLLIARFLGEVLAKQKEQADALV